VKVVRRKVNWSRIVLMVLLVLSLALNYVAVRSALYDDEQLRMRLMNFPVYCED
jgi:hypothetical protein